jgi:DNA-binding IclR family transcriptional regulator
MSNGSLPVGESATLRALIQYPDGLRRSQLTVLTGYKRSTRDAYIARLRDKGYVTASNDKVWATGTGIGALPDAEPLPTGEALREFWYRELPEGERVLLQYLVTAYPDAAEKTTIGDATGYKRSTRDAYLSRLTAKQLVVDAGHGAIRASETLFEVIG